MTDRLQRARACVEEGIRSVEAGHVERAREVLAEAAALAPDWSATHYNLAVALARLKDFTAAERALRITLDLEPERAAAAHLLGAVLTQSDRMEEAIPLMSRAVAAGPDMALWRRDLGVAQLFMGDIDAARENLLRAVELDPMSRQVLPMIVELTPSHERPAESLRVKAVLERLALAAGDLDETGRVELYFALFRAHEQRGEVDAAWDFLERANRLKRRSVSFDMQAHERAVRAIQAAFDRPLLERLLGGGGGVADERPIFIFGLPRSGTTLLEQIISTHPQVQGGGELLTLINVLAGARDAQGRPYPDWIPRMSAEDGAVVAQAYLSALPPLAADKRRITDKRLENFAHAGVIAAALPNAVMIHCRRDPRDMAFSCYGTMFLSGQDWAYDLAAIDKYRQLEEELMDHWRRILPPGRILEVQYEDVVADLEGQTRRVLEHCRLSWDPACLRFNETRRSVRSASVVQVRRPLYDSAVGRWKPFETYLAPIWADLGAP